ncbi:hypothetical protein OBBRIDRAFT_143789 [Obba rivulosa]|uniref:Uncharacterized protein n=1 Tax=Obba rivulosa TaxID=1052685 RepID=A0A8E2DRA7_9APHY|nr:hypothetical protein OBBRIDRAFT_143789 [Obba rivulosa]
MSMFADIKNHRNFRAYSRIARSVLWLRAAWLLGLFRAAASESITAFLSCLKTTSVAASCVQCVRPVAQPAEVGRTGAPGLIEYPEDRCRRLSPHVCPALTADLWQMQIPYDISIRWPDRVSLEHKMLSSEQIYCHRHGTKVFQVQEGRKIDGSSQHPAPAALNRRDTAADRSGLASVKIVPSGNVGARCRPKSLPGTCRALAF